MDWERHFLKLSWRVWGWKEMPKDIAKGIKGLKHNFRARRKVQWAECVLCLHTHSQIRPWHPALLGATSEHNTQCSPLVPLGADSSQNPKTKQTKNTVVNKDLNKGLFSFVEAFFLGGDGGSLSHMGGDQDLLLGCALMDHMWYKGSNMG